MFQAQNGKKNALWPLTLLFLCGLGLGALEVSADPAIIGSPSLGIPLASVDMPRKLPLDLYQALSRKRIGTIEIEVREIFDESDISDVYRQVNQLKINTRKEVIQRELLFKEGETFDLFKLKESERVLRGLKYLRSVQIVPVLSGDVVNIKVIVQDTWTLIPEIGYSSGTGKTRQYVGIAESNIAGLGKRGGFVNEKDGQRQSWQAVYGDPRVGNSSIDALGAYLDRSDGTISILEVSDPFRSLLDKTSWKFSIENGDTVGRLFNAGEERYIFRQKSTDLSGRYTVAQGNPEMKLTRYSIGYDYRDFRFSQATTQDFLDLELDPLVVSSDPSELASNRRFTGPSFAFETIYPDYISMNYIDRFDRVEDYNLGDRFSFNILLSPEMLGSLKDTMLFSGSKSKGARFGDDAFLRGEIGFATRYESGNLQDSLLRGELKYFNVLGERHLGGVFLGRHTLACSSFIDYGDSLDKDREFLIGSDNVLRGYKQKTFSGDKRFGVNLEDRIHIADDLFHLVSVGAATFIDIGGASDRPLGKLLGDETYSDVGVGLRFAFPRSSGGSVLRIDFAVPMRDGPDGSNAFQLRVLFSGGQLFTSHLRSEDLGAEKANVAVGFDQ